jgi:hypothetical protein
LTLDIKRVISAKFLKTEIMDIQKFEDFEQSIRGVTCPEHLFGNIKLSTDIAAYKKLRDEKYEYLQKITKNPKSGNEEMRVSMVLSLFLLLDKWGLEKVTAGVYGNYTTYRLKLMFQVKEWNKKHHFFLIRNDSFHFDEIPGYYFEDGYTHSDEVCVLREGVPIKKGHTSEYGTHGATTCFYGINKNSPCPYLKASDFELYDIVEIETWKYGSFHEFYNMIK